MNDYDRLGLAIADLKRELLNALRPWLLSVIEWLGRLLNRMVRNNGNQEQAD